MMRAILSLCFQLHAAAPQRGLRRATSLVLSLLATLLATAPARAQFIWFPFTLNAGENGVVAERIVRNPVSGIFDYQYFLFNTGFRNIDGFSLFVGNPFPLGVNNALFVATRLGGGDGPFPNIVATGNLGVPFLTGVASWTFAATPSWGFEEFDNRPFAGPNPNYLVRWYAPLQGAAFPATMPPGFYTRFDLFSRFGPVAGGGAVDPFAGGGLIIDDGLNDFDTLLFNQSVTPCTLGAANCDLTTTPNPTTDDPNAATDFPNGFNLNQQLGQANDTVLDVPEPASGALLGGGLAVLWRVRRRSSKRRT
jgi:hypothetical protein